MRAACALAALVLAGSVACSAVDVDLTDRPCAGGECIDGYLCSPFTDTCVQALEVGCRAAGAVCPATTRTGDGCSVVDSFLPCVEGAGCERGCRLCQDDLSWSACEGCTLGDVRTCASCDDDCTSKVRNAGALCDGSPPACDYDECAAGAVDIDGERDNGCECLIVGAEVPCNGVDDDCDGDDATTSGVLEHCAACGDDCRALPGVGEVVCDTGGSAPACEVIDCAPGFVNLDGESHNGCEAGCVVSGLEICDGADNDCDGGVDDFADPTATCTTQLGFPDGVDVWQCTPAGACAIVVCSDGWLDVDEEPDNGCELFCTPTGAEACNGDDDDCNGVPDDVEPSTLLAECLTVHPGAAWVDWACDGMCQMAGCLDGNVDLDGELENGCEYACTVRGLESLGGGRCSDVDDNDCDGCIDDADPDCGPSWWNTDWPARRSITVTPGAVSLPSGYTLELVVDHGTLVSAGLSRPDAFDLRIVYWSGSAWIQLDRVLGTDALLADGEVELLFRTAALIPPTGSAGEYWLYHGKLDAGPPPSDPHAVYLFYDDFESGALASWSAAAGVNGYWAVTTAQKHGGTYALKAGSVNLVDYWLVADGVDAADIQLRAWWRLSRGTGINVGQGVRADVDATPITQYEGGIDEVIGGFILGEVIANTLTMRSQEAPLTSVPIDTWFQVTTIVSGTSMRVLRDGVQLLPPPPATWQEVNGITSGSIAFRTWILPTPAEWWIDDVVARRFVDPEPITAIGAEQVRSCDD